MHQRLRTFFQPIGNLRSGELHGLEALARWPADDEPVPPSEFIEVAEESGLIGPLGVLVLRSACETLSDRRGRGVVAPEVTVSVNVSIRQITDGGLVEHVRAALHDHDLPPANLVLEITESTLIENPELVSAVLDDLLTLGVAIQLDDFGTGYSSLTTSACASSPKASNTPTSAPPSPPCAASTAGAFTSPAPSRARSSRSSWRAAVAGVGIARRSGGPRPDNPNLSPMGITTRMRETGTA